MTKIDKIEYLTIEITNDDELNRLGEEKWELVAVYEGAMYFKRKVDEIKM